MSNQFYKLWGIGPDSTVPAGFYSSAGKEYGIVFPSSWYRTTDLQYEERNQTLFFHNTSNQGMSIQVVLQEPDYNIDRDLERVKNVFPEAFIKQIGDYMAIETHDTEADTNTRKVIWRIVNGITALDIEFHAPLGEYSRRLYSAVVNILKTLEISQDPAGRHHGSFSKQEGMNLVGTNLDVLQSLKKERMIKFDIDKRETHLARQRWDEFHGRGYAYQLTKACAAHIGKQLKEGTVDQATEFKILDMETGELLVTYSASGGYLETLPDNRAGILPPS